MAFETKLKGYYNQIFNISPARFNEITETLTELFSEKTIDEMVDIFKGKFGIQLTNLIDTLVLYDDNNEMLSSLGYETAIMFNEKFVKSLSNSKVADRKTFVDGLKKLVIEKRNKKSKFYASHEALLTSMGLTEKLFGKFIKALLKDEEKGKKIVKIIEDNVRNMGYVGREEMFEKFYQVVNELLGGHRVNPEVIYGDSVVEDTPLLLRKNGDVMIMTINELGNTWSEYHGDKLHDDNVKDYEVWSDLGWTRIKNVIKHKTTKKVYEILTHTGCVRVTEDHSLLSPTGEKLSPKDCNIDSQILHSFPKIFNNNDNDNNITDDMAYIYGFFVGDGSCGKYGKSNTIKYSWALNNADLELCENLKAKLENIYKKKFVILDTIKSSGVYKVVPSCGDIKTYAQLYRNKFYDNYKHKIIPSEIFTSSITTKEKFMEGFYAADGNRSDTKQCGCHRFDQKSQISAMNFYYLLKSMGYNVSINKRNDKPDIFRITYSLKKQRKNASSIKKITEMPHETRWVYDLETENHHFHAGVGEIIVHNTDSVFYKMNIRNDKTGIQLRNRKELEMCISLGIWGSILICTMLPAPMRMAYEKSLWPFAIISKKRYVGNLYEKNPNKFYQKSMGLVLKRRDNAPIVKIVCGGIVNQLLNNLDKGAEGALLFARKTLKEIVTGKYKLDKFVISKTLRSEYANRNAMVHAVLADRIAERDPGNKPQSNDRIPYAFIEVDKEVEVQGDRVEHPEYIKEKGLKLDYLFYITNQIMKPCMQFLELILENPDQIFREYIIKEENRKKCMMPMGYYFNDDKNETETDKKDQKVNFDELVDEEPDEKIAKVHKKNKNVEPEKRPKQSTELVDFDEVANDINRLNKNKSKSDSPKNVIKNSKNPKVKKPKKIPEVKKQKSFNQFIAKKDDECIDFDAF